MGEHEMRAIIRAGSEARAIGCCAFDNPYLPPIVRARAEYRVSAWPFPAKAWHNGWLLEDAVREGR